MSNWADRQFLFNQPEVAAQGIVEGIVRFVELDLY